ncbi:MAG: hypothetical protein PF692_14065 [Kiritimatiellae bacterium]|jgi:hypothetical protein|nr:hypothetical protein [Kiritimatiellia bacterium]
MKYNAIIQQYKAYLIILCVSIISGISYIFAKNQDILQILISIPFAGSLITALVQVLKDQAAHERALILQESGNRFILGAGSHMGNVAFDKHVEFSEKYVKEAQSTLTTFLQEGPTEKALKHAWTLLDIRNEYIIWLPDSLEKALAPFEKTLREIGAKAHYVEAVRENRKDSEDRSKALEKLFNMFAKVMGFDEWEGEKLNDELAIAAIIRKLRGILGTEELTSLRTFIIRRAIQEIKKKG